MSAPVRIGIAVAVVVALLAGSLVAIPRFRQPPAAFSLIDETTLIPLKGTVQVQRPAAAFTIVTADTVVRVGDRIRTGPDSYAVVTYFDGSTTTLDPDTEILLRRLDKLPQGGANISFQQEIGLTWNRVEKLVGPESRFETTTAAATAFVRGTDFTVRVEATGVTIVEAVTDPVTVEAAGVTVVVLPGFQTTVVPGQPPSEPVPVAPASFAFLLEVDGLVSFWLTDGNNRSVGFHPQADAFANQIPGARYSLGSQRLELPDPVSSYELSFKAVGEGGAYSATITTLRDGQPLAARGPGLARVLFQGRRVDGSIRPGEGYDRSQLTFDRTVGAQLGPLVRVGGEDVTGKADFALRQVGAVLGILTGPTATAISSPTPAPTPTATPTAETLLPEEPTPTSSPTPRESPTPSPTPRESPTPSPTPRESPTPSPTPGATATPTERPAATETPIALPTETPPPELTATPEATPVPTPTPSPTPPVAGGITISKDTLPDHGQDFAFTATGTGVSDFRLDDDADPTLPNSRAFSGLEPGTYTFAEGAVSGFDLVLIECSGPGGSTFAYTGATTNPTDGFELGDTTARVNLAAGDRVTCTFLNYQRGRILVEKATSPAGAPATFSFQSTWTTAPFSLTDASPPQDSGPLRAARWGVAELIPSGWRLTGISCTSSGEGPTRSTVLYTGPGTSPTDRYKAGDNTANVDLAPGDTVTCVFTNTAT